MPEREMSRLFPGERPLQRFLDRFKLSYSSNYDRHVNPIRYDALVNNNGSREWLAGTIGRWFTELYAGVPAGTPLPVLDIAAGTGFLSRELHHRDFQVTALDLSHSMLARLKEQSQGTFRPVQADMNERFPFQDNSFVGATTLWGNRYIKDPKHFLGETYRVLEEGGIFVWPIILSDKRSWKFLSHNLRLKTHPIDLAKIAVDTGFSYVKIFDMFDLSSRPIDTRLNDLPIQLIVAQK